MVKCGLMKKVLFSIKQSFFNDILLTQQAFVQVFSIYVFYYFLRTLQSKNFTACYLDSTCCISIFIYSFIRQQQLTTLESVPKKKSYTRDYVIKQYFTNCLMFLYILQDLFEFSAERSFSPLAPHLKRSCTRLI